MVSGHSYLPNDADFGVIERATKKTADIFLPEQWCSVIEKCNRKNKFCVVRMQSDMFKSVNELSKTMTVRKQSETGEKVEWLKIQWIRVCKAEPLKMFFKYSVQEDVEFSSVNFAKKGRKCKDVRSQGTISSAATTNLYRQNQRLAETAEVHTTCTP